MNMHPIFERVISDHMAAFYKAPKSDDLPRAVVETNAPLRLGTLHIHDLAGRVHVYRDGDEIAIDDIEIEGFRHNRQALQGIGLNSRADTSGWAEHVLAQAFHDLLDDPDFLERADAALIEIEREWVAA